MSVKVAVRVRPFNAREKELNCQLCVQMANNTTVLINPEDGKTRDFTFDYSFWSHDEFEEDENGYLKATTEKYADQMRVFNTVGKEVLDNAWEGYHCCLFAYGQTGSGKSYSMVGYNANKGIVPISMKEIFTRTEANTNPDISFEITFSMLEIYNEKIQDLLIQVKDRPQEGLKVREHQKYGVYVEGLKKVAVDTYEAIEAKMDEGNKNRTIGSTMMNNSSSRAHTIIQIEFKKIEIIDKKKTERFSLINLVDLAGSEKLAKTGAQGDRMKEGCAINKSLSTLGLVISKLAEKSEAGKGKKDKIIVPYRDSVLTRILQNALGGNSKTLMICAISPATDNYDETLSTLRYADQAKKIKCHAVINESEQDKMIRELREENDKLKELLKNFKPGEVGTGYNMIDEETLKRFREMEEQYKANLLLMQENEKSYKEKLMEAKEKEKKDEEPTIDMTKPYLTNLNEDPILSGKVLHSLSKDKVFVGKKNGDPVPDLVLGGVSIKPNHAIFYNDEGKITLKPLDEDAAEQTFINGQKLSLEARELFHNDRIMFGTNSCFLFKYPGMENISPNGEKVKDSEIDWEFAQAELVELNKEKKKKHEEVEKAVAKETEEKIRDIEAKFQTEKQEKEKELQIQKDEYERKIKEHEEKRKQESENQRLEIERKELEKEWNAQFAKYEQDRLLKERERERMQKEVQEEASFKRFKEQEKIYIEQKLAKNLSKITEVNLISKELKRDISFSVKLGYNYVSGAELNVLGGEKIHKPKVQILVQNREVNTKYVWSMNKFTNRYFMIKDLLEAFYDSGQTPPKNTKEDPFWDPPEPSAHGQGFISLESLAYLIDNPAEVILVDHGKCGKIDVNLIPCNPSGELIGENAEDFEDPQKLIGQRLDFLLEIASGELDYDFVKDTYCEYALLGEDDQFKTFKTSTVEGNTKSPQYNYKFQHTYTRVNEKILNYLLTHNLKIQLFGSEIPEVKPSPETSSPEKITGDAVIQVAPNSNEKKGRRQIKIDIEDDENTTPAEKKDANENNSVQKARENPKQNQAVTKPAVVQNTQQDIPNKYNQGIIGSGAAFNPNKVPITQRPMTPQANDPKSKGGKKKEEGKDKDCNIF